MLDSGSSCAPGETLRLTAGGDNSIAYAFYSTAGSFDAVWAGWCGGLLAANEPSEWTAPSLSMEVTLLYARSSIDAPVVVFETVSLWVGS